MTFSYNTHARNINRDTTFNYAS